MIPIITKVQPLSNYRLRLTFKDAGVRDFDMNPFLNRGVFKELQNPALFRQVYISLGTIAWPNDVRQK